jgi:transcriptional regulator with XRE-family HTH domain
MTMVKPLAQTRDTVTLKRDDFDALLRRIEDVADLAAVDAHRAYEDRVGWDTARQNYLTVDEARRLLDGESPVRVWRLKRGIKQRTLAEAAEIAVSYLAEIEGGKKPGSPGALQRIASVLEMPLESLIASGLASGFRPIYRADAAAKRLIACAESTTSNAAAKLAAAVVEEWRRAARQGGWQHQVQAAIEVLHRRLADAAKEAQAGAAAMERDGEDSAARQRQHVTRVLGRMMDALTAKPDTLVDE